MLRNFLHGDSLLVLGVDMTAYKIASIVRRRRREDAMGRLMLFCQVSHWESMKGEQRAAGYISPLSSKAALASFFLRL